MADDILAAIDAATGCQQCGGPLTGSVSDDFCRAECQISWHAEQTEELVGYREPWDRPIDFPGIATEAHDSGSLLRSVAGRGSWQSVGTVRGASLSLAQVDELHGNSSLFRPEGPEADSITFTVEPVVAARFRAVLLEAQAWRLPRLTGNVVFDMRVARLAAASATTAEQRAAVALRQQMLAEQMSPQLEALGRGLQQMVEGFATAVSSAAEALAEGLRKAFGLPDPPVVIQHQRTGRPEVVSLQEHALQARRNRNTGPPRRERPPRRVDPRGGLYR